MIGYKDEGIANTLCRDALYTSLARDMYKLKLIVRAKRLGHEKSYGKRGGNGLKLSVKGEGQIVGRKNVHRVESANLDCLVKIGVIEDVKNVCGNSVICDNLRNNSSRAILINVDAILGSCGHDGEHGAHIGNRLVVVSVTHEARSNGVLANFGVASVIRNPDAKRKCAVNLDRLRHASVYKRFVGKADIAHIIDSLLYRKSGSHRRNSLVVLVTCKGSRNGIDTCVGIACAVGNPYPLGKSARHRKGLRRTVIDYGSVGKADTAHIIDRLSNRPRVRKRCGLALVANLISERCFCGIVARIRCRVARKLCFGNAIGEIYRLNSDLFPAINQALCRGLGSLDNPFHTTKVKCRITCVCFLGRHGESHSNRHNDGKKENCNEPKLLCKVFHKNLLSQIPRRNIQKRTNIPLVMTYYNIRH